MGIFDRIESSGSPRFGKAEKLTLRYAQSDAPGARELAETPGSLGHDKSGGFPLRKYCIH
jgi:hypothetical protein